MDADTEQRERDIVERLREFAAMYADRQKLVTSELMASAADEITRLRAQPSPREVALRDALYDLVEAVKREVNGGDSGSGYLLARLSDARRALSPASDECHARKEDGHEPG